MSYEEEGTCISVSCVSGLVYVVNRSGADYGIANFCWRGMTMEELVIEKLFVDKVSGVSLLYSAACLRVCLLTR